MTIAPEECGFTLLEMLVALAIMALGAGIVFPALTRLADSRTLDEATMTLRLALTDARADALRQDRAAALRADRGGRMLVFSSGRPARALPDDATVRLPEGGITFYPDHSASGGEGTIDTARGSRRIGVRAQDARIGGPQ